MIVLAVRKRWSQPMIKKMLANFFLGNTALSNILVKNYTMEPAVVETSFDVTATLSIKFYKFLKAVLQPFKFQHSEANYRIT